MPHSMPTTLVGYTERARWFHEARLGLFPQYSFFTDHRRGERLMFNERMPVA